MEPPGEGRYEARGVAQLGLGNAAAMEPPGEGRYEEHMLDRPVEQTSAAMEPPGEGRYEWARCRSTRSTIAGRNGAAR